MRANFHEFYGKLGWGPNYWKIIDWTCADAEPLIRKEFDILVNMHLGGFENLPPRNMLLVIDRLVNETACGYSRRNLVTVLRLAMCDSELFWL
jgi:hypothetical protein